MDARRPRSPDPEAEDTPSGGVPSPGRPEPEPPAGAHPARRRAYMTDLTDDQWAGLHAAVLGPAGHGEEVREVVNGIRYWERSCQCWWLLPPGFPPPDTVRAWYDKWAAAGTWARCEEFLADTPTPPRPLSPRQQLAAAAREFPGGRAVVWLSRKAIQAVQKVRSLCTPREWPARRFLWTLRRADRLLQRERHTAAARAYSAALRRYPRHPYALVWGATALYHTGRYPEAVDHCRLALSSPQVLTAHKKVAHRVLAKSLALAGGDLLDAARHWCEANWAAASEKSGFRDGLGPLTRLEGLMSAIDDLAEFLMNFHARFDLGMALWKSKPAAGAALARGVEPPRPGKVLYLSEDWVRNIGHTGLIDTLIKVWRLGWADWDRVLLLAPGEMHYLGPRYTANMPLARYWERYCEVVTDDREAERLRPFAASFGPRVAGALALPDGTDVYFTEGVGIVEQEWARQDRGPLLSLSERDADHARAALRRLGVPDGAWFVCLHVREPGYYHETRVSHQSHRNAVAATYLPAVREIHRRGGWVLRLGDKSMAPLPRTPGFIDYARSPVKSDRLDVALVASCRFFVGVASGMCQIPPAFGVPVLNTNWASNALPQFGRRDLFIPKLVRRRSDGRVLAFDEWLSRPVRVASYAQEALDRAGYEVVDNTPDELRDAVVEMITRLEGRWPEADGERDRQAAFEALLAAHGHRGVATMAATFLTRHASLLPGPTHLPAAPARHAANRRPGLRSRASA